MESNDLEELFRRYSRSVLRRATTILGDADAAKDAVQEVFLRVMNSRTKLSELESPMVWLYRVTTNLCLNRLRDRARQRKILSEPPSEPPPRNESSMDAAMTVRALLRNVPATLQEIAVYYFVDHMSQDEISQILGIPRRTVGHRLEEFRAAALADPTREVAS
jgi:RNA polymerase sigma-70 factor (ECF subfamily)